jgi:hypothetical protein
MQFQHLLSGTAPLGVTGESPLLLTHLANVAAAALPSGPGLSQPNPADDSELPSLPIGGDPLQPSPPLVLSPKPSKDKRSDANPLSSSKKAKLTKKKKALSGALRDEMSRTIAMVSLMSVMKDSSMTKKNQEKKMQDLFHGGKGGAFPRVSQFNQCRLSH